MSELRELYQEYVLDHGKNPRNFGPLASATHHAEGYNPLCGDKLRLELEVREGVIRDVKFSGSGCAISTASASTMTEAIKGKTLEEAKRFFGLFISLVKGEIDAEQLIDAPDVDDDEAEQLEKLSVFGGVAEFPMRVKCATLAWHTLTAALEGDGSATTE